MCVATVHTGENYDDNNNKNNNNKNGTSFPSIIEFNNKIIFTQSYDTRHVTSYCSAVKNWLLRPDWPSPQVTEIVSDLPL